MSKKRRTVVTLEIDEMLVVNRGGVVGRTRCGECTAETVMITPEQAAANLRISTRLIYRLIEGNRVHFTETPSGSLRLCLSSLLANLAETFEAGDEEAANGAIPLQTSRRSHASRGKH